jgi:hypothetical protein
MKKLENLRDFNAKVKEKHTKLVDTFNILTETEAKIKAEQEKLNKKLFDINKKILQYTEEIDAKMKDDSSGNLISNNYIKEKCIEKFDSLFYLRENNDEKGKEEKVKNKDKKDDRMYEFRIEYSNTIFTRVAEKENMTFLDLKNDMKFQIGRSENEFFFRDKNNNLYLDNFRIREILFPFKKVIIKNNIPTIYIIENNVEKDVYLDMARIEEERNLQEDLQKLNDGEKNKLYDTIKKIISGYIYMIIFVIFIFFLFLSIDSYRDVENYFSMNYTYYANGMINVEYISSEKNFLEEIKKKYIQLFQFDEEKKNSKLKIDIYIYIFYSNLNFFFFYFIF